jgi:uncharacterized protein (DUF433 family)
MQRVHNVSRFLDTDPRELPAYTVSEAAHYLSIPRATLRAWVFGRDYLSKSGVRRFSRIIEIPNPETGLLSFFNLAEAHALRAFRNRQVELNSIRRALLYVKKKLGWSRPLLEQRFATDGVSLFFESLGRLLDASAGGQMAIREIMEAHLHRLEWGDGMVVRIYPFTRANAEEDAPRAVVIDPRHSFGRPILGKCRIATSVIAGRYKAGDSIEHLAEEYGCSQLEIEEGIRCELKLQAAA